MIRALFLDLDGVLIPGPFGRGLMSAAELHGFAVDPQQLDPFKVELLNELRDVPDLRLVLSSSMRGDDGIVMRLRAQGIVIPFHDNWRTGWETPPNEPRVRLAPRGWQIKCWLDCEEVTSYAIVDDDSDMLPDQALRFSKSCREAGLMPWQVREIREMLLS